MIGFTHISFIIIAADISYFVMLYFLIILWSVMPCTLVGSY